MQLNRETKNNHYFLHGSVQWPSAVEYTDRIIAER